MSAREQSWCLRVQMFVIGHDCGHRSFSKNKLVEDIVGTLMFMPLIYPFEPWRIKHNHHHAHTNKYAFPPPAHSTLSAMCIAEAYKNCASRTRSH